LFRLCGTPGDIIEMKNGVLFVNNKNFDSQLDLKNQFKVGEKDFYEIEQEDIYDNDSNEQVIRTSDSVIVTFDKVLLKKYQSKITLTPYLINDTSTLSGCFKWFDKHSIWTTDNFGPLKIPYNNYFVLGDNRHNAMDSRYFGFVIKDDIKGVMLGR
jgi:signal peptidase I